MVVMRKRRNRRHVETKTIKQLAKNDIEAITICLFSVDSMKRQLFEKYWRPVNNCALDYINYLHRATIISTESRWRRKIVLVCSSYKSIMGAHEEEEYVAARK